jgi:hypothetical protein
MFRTIGLAMLAALIFSGVAAAQNSNRERAILSARSVELLDIDGNGTVSLGEILAEHGRLFTAADLDGDGAMADGELSQGDQTVGSSLRC